jgi:hypothetical protein
MESPFPRTRHEYVPVGSARGSDRGTVLKNATAPGGSRNEGARG